MNKEEFMEAAWVGFIEWAIKQPGIRTKFQEATGLDLGYRSPPENGLDALIDKTTGYNKRPPDKEVSVAMEAFVLWVTEHYWGLNEAPTKVREAVLVSRGEHGKTGAGNAGRD